VNYLKASASIGESESASRLIQRKSPYQK